MKRTFVISGFPGVGKSFCYKNYQDEYSILDSDSSEFSWIKDENGNNTTERNPEFPSNYIQHIKSNIGKVDIIFVSSHAGVRKALAANNIKTIIIYPDKNIKIEWIERLSDRGSSQSFIDFISNNWYTFLDEIRDESLPGFLKIVLRGDRKCIDLDLIQIFFNDENIIEFSN